MDHCEWCSKPCPAWSAMCVECAAPLGGLPNPPKIDGYLILEDGMPLRDINIAEIGRSIQLVGAVYADDQDAFLVMLPDATSEGVAITLGNIEARTLDGDDHRVVAVNLTLDEWQEFLRQTDLVEVRAMVKDPETGRVAKAIVRKSQRQVSKIVSWNVFRRDEFACRYCGANDVPLTVDHLVTWESGGPSTEANLVAACSKCNNKRGETPYGDWLRSSYYKRVSKGLPMSVRFANTALEFTLDAIQRVPLLQGKKRKRR